MSGQASTSATPSPRTVLLVDDDALVRSLLGRVLSEDGYAVLVAADGQEALALASTLDGQLSLVVTDVRMPVMDGLELASHLIESNPKLPIMFISGFLPATAKVPGLLLTKPFTLTMFLNHVHQLIGSSVSASQA
jgi:CheY-like chemotaxis protein